jgi:hypothetical protein
MHPWHPQHLLSLYELVPLEQEPKPPIKTSPQMQIYNENYHNRYIEEDEGYIMKKFTNFLEKNPKEARKISSSNVKISYNISPQNELSLSFKFEDKTANEVASSDSSKITFINNKDQQFKTQKSESIIKIETEAKTQKEAEDKAKREVEEKAKREAEERVKREAEDKANKEAEEKAKREAEEKAKREAEDKDKKEAEKAKKEAEDRMLRKKFTKITKDVVEVEVELLLQELKAVNTTSTIASAPVESNTETHEHAVGITKIDEIRIIIQSIIDSAQSTQQSRLSALNLIESTDLTPSKSAIASINRLTSFDCARSPKKENNFYEILTTNPEARSSLIDYLAEYDIDEKKIKHGSLVRLLIDKKESFTKSDVLIDNHKIMEDLVIDLGLKMLSNLEGQEDNLKKSNGKIEKFASKTRSGRLDFSDELPDHENLAQNTEAQKRVQALTEKNIETINEKLEDFLEKMVLTKEELLKIKEERITSSAHPSTSVSQADQKVTSQARSHG